MKEKCIITLKAGERWYVRDTSCASLATSRLYLLRIALRDSGVSVPVCSGGNAISLLDRLLQETGNVTIYMECVDDPAMIQPRNGSHCPKGGRPLNRDGTLLKQ